MVYARSLAFMAYFTLSVLVIGVLAAPYAMTSHAATKRVVKTWCRMTLGILKIVAGVSYRLEGASRIPAQGALIAANHQSQWETIALYAHLPDPAMIIKKELLRLPIYGWWVKRAGSIPIDREGGAKALRAMRREAARQIAAGKQVVVFPEGTRAAVGERLAFQSGVAGLYKDAKAPCAPVAHNSGEHWRYPGLRKVPGEIILRFLEPIPPGLDRRDFLQVLQARIEAGRPDLAPAATRQASSDD
ncbi:MAG: lysophospholipid acyltransferase family protein [Hyphococcus sp.]